VLPDGVDIPKRFLEDHNAFVEMYRNQNWEGVKTHVKKYKETVPSFNLYYELISNRTQEYIKNPPPSDWEGVFVAKTK